MKMVNGGGSSLSQYSSFIYNCTLGQFNYKIPAYSLGDIELYLDGFNAPGSASYQLIHTCGDTIGTIENITPNNYVFAQDTNGDYYGVIRGFNESTTAKCFVIGITVDGTTFFSQEYCIDPCDRIGIVYGCYGNLDPKISYDANGIYFGLPQGNIQGTSNLVYVHYAYLRNVEITLNAIKNEFKQGRTRTFRTESSDLYLFWGELVPEWYIKHIDAVFKRGEVYINGDQLELFASEKALVESTAYEKVDECVKGWKPTATLKVSQYQSFTCEADPCTTFDGGGEPPPPTPTCCDPIIINAQTTFDGDQNNTVVEFTPCAEMTPANGYVLLWRVVGSGGGYTNAGSTGSSPFEFSDSGHGAGTSYEGYIYADCGDGTTGNLVAWSTQGTTVYAISLASPCTGQFSSFIVTGGTPGDSVTVRVTYSGLMQKISGSFVRADVTMTGQIAQSTSSPCFSDTGAHSFFITIDETFIMTGSTQSVTVNAVVNNSSASMSSMSVSIVDVNGVDPGKTAAGCNSNSSTGGTC